MSLGRKPDSPAAACAAMSAAASTVVLARTVPNRSSSRGGAFMRSPHRTPPLSLEVTLSAHAVVGAGAAGNMTAMAPRVARFRLALLGFVLLHERLARADPPQST